MNNMIGQRIKKRRDELRLTPRDIKSITGIGSGHLSEMETGKKLPSTPTLIKLSEVLHCSIDWILLGETCFCEPLKTTPSVRESEFSFLFNKLSPGDQEEVLEIIRLKIRRQKNVGKSSNSIPESNTASA